MPLPQWPPAKSLDSKWRRPLCMLFLDKLLTQYLFKHFLDKHLVGLEWRLRKSPAHPSAEELVDLACSRKRM